MASRPYNGPVYSIEVEEDHSYTVKGLSVQNSDLGGYANLNREIVLRLCQRGFVVKVDMLRTMMQVDPVTLATLRAMESVKLRNPRCPMVVGFVPMAIDKRRDFVAFYTMMETQSIHPEFVNRCNTMASEVWVPCEFYANVFRVMPLGVNHHTYTPDAEEPSLSYEEMPSGGKTSRLPDKFRFISVFGWSYRKGPDILCRSFLRGFDAGDDAMLVLYSRYYGSSEEKQKDVVRKEIRSYYEAEGKRNPPPIYYCGDLIGIGDMPGIYASADAFAFASRGEGFGLPLVEAGACSIPIVSSYNTAMTNLLDEDTAYLVPPEGYATANEKLTWISEYYRDQEFAVHGEDSIRGFMAKMRRLRSSPEEAGAKAMKLRERILREFTWDAAADRVAKRLREVS
jgi:glycosyltransferase involved in cell wall biosynthesis